MKRPTKGQFEDFATDLLDMAYRKSEVDCDTMQDLAEHHGLIQKVVANEPCGSGCLCAEITNFPVICYRKNY